MSLGLLLRVPVFVAVTLGLAGGAHIVAGGAPPSVGRLALLGVPVALVWWLLARAEQSLKRLAATLWTMQAVLHVALAGGGCRMSAAGSGPLPGHGGIHAAAEPITTSCTGLVHAGSGMVHHPGSGLSPVWMLLAHALAGLLAAAWLRRGEAAAWRAVRRLLPSLPAAARLPLVPARPDHALPTVPASPPAVFVLLCDPRRGPPLPVG